VVRALQAEVVLEGKPVGGREGLGPVAALPCDAVRKEVALVDVMSGGALELLDEVGERYGRLEAEYCVDVIGSASSGEQHAFRLACLASEDGGEAVVELWRQHRVAAKRCPNDVNEDECGRALRHALFIGRSRRKVARESAADGNRETSWLVEGV